VLAAALVVTAGAVTAVSPALGALTIPPLVVLAAAATHRAGTARASAAVAIAVALTAAAVLIALEPLAGAIGAAAIWLVTLTTRGATGRDAAVRFVHFAAPPLAAGASVALALTVGWRPGAAALGASVAFALTVAVRPKALLVAMVAVASACLALLVALRPGPAALGAAAAAATALTWRARGVLAPPLALAGRALAAALLVAGLTVSATVYPATTLLWVLVLGIVVLSFRSPPLALAAAVLLFSFEGSVKILLGLEGTPLGDNRAVGAAALDVALIAGMLAVFASDRFVAPRAVWAAAGGAERVAIGLVGAWLALSVLQIAQGGDIARGAYGFRLFQWYALLGLAALTVFAQPRLRHAALQGVLAIGFLVSLYAATRVVFGPADAEYAFALSVPTTSAYGDAVRAIGSFSSAIGLSSFMTPMAAFALVLGLLAPRYRLFAWSVSALALIGLIGSYSRASLFGLVLGTLFAIVLMVATGDVSRRRKLVAAGVFLALLGGTYGGVLVASRAAPELKERAQGILDPLGDASVRLRFETWGSELRDSITHPLGQGVGSVGAASAPTRRQVRTTDNSFIKVLVEQGVLGFALFAGGLLMSMVLLARRLRAAAPAVRGPALAALAGFVAFLGLSISGETVEQPGKLVAWGLLGLATALAFARVDPEAAPA
jgi:O-antigen ligase